MYEFVDKYFVLNINDKTLPIGQYCVLKTGTVLTRMPGISKFRELKGFPDGRRGYLKVKLYTTERKPATVSIHRLVYTTIAGIPYGSKGTINHKDGNKLNNEYDNLELISNKENVRHSIINKLSPSRAHMLTVETGVKVYLEAVENKANGYSMVYTVKSVGYDPKVIKQLLTKTHTLSKEIDEYLKKHNFTS